MVRDLVVAFLVPRTSEAHVEQVPLIDRILAKVKETPGPLDTDCFVWHGALRDGRPLVRRSDWEHGDRKLVNADTVMWEALHGAAPKGSRMAHLCGDSACVRPAHLAPAPRYGRRGMGSR